MVINCRLASWKRLFYILQAYSCTHHHSCAPSFSGGVESFILFFTESCAGLCLSQMLIKRQICLIFRSLFMQSLASRLRLQAFSILGLWKPMNGVEMWSVRFEIAFREKDFVAVQIQTALYFTAGLNNSFKIDSEFSGVILALWSDN